MITRRILRIKVFQTYFAYCNGSFNLNEKLATDKNKPIISLRTSIDDKLRLAEKFLLDWLNAYYGLYFFIFRFLIALRDFDQRKIELGKRKLLPNEEDLNPSYKFTNNIVIQILKNNHYFDDYEKRFSIIPENFDDFVAIFYKKLAEQDFFKLYKLKSEDNNFQEDKEILLKILEFAWDNDEFFDFVEEATTFWVDNIDFALERVYFTINKLLKEDAEDKDFFLPQFRSYDDKQMALNLLRKAIVNQDQYLDYIEDVLTNWDLLRLAATDRANLLLAITEAINFPEIPLSVTMDEYIEIGKYFGTEKSYSFINGTLQAIFCKLLQEKEIRKTGRGLIDKFKKEEKCKNY